MKVYMDDTETLKKVCSLGIVGHYALWNFLNGTTVFSSTHKLVLFEMYEWTIRAESHSTTEDVGVDFQEKML